MAYLETLSGDNWLVRVAVIALVMLAAILAYDAAMALGRRSLRLRAVIGLVRRPGRVIVATLVLLASLTALDLPPGPAELIHRGLTIGLVGVAGFIAARLVALAFERAMAPYAARQDSASRARRTQLAFFRRTAVWGVVAATVALCLTTVPAVRAMGLSLFASAGIAGIVIGLAAQPTIANLIAGIQIALTQPIRIGDAVVVENEWGRVEEISSTYVVVAIWDERRLVLPLSYFLQRPFQNWTRQSSQLLAPVMLYADYALPVAELRQQLERIARSTPLWDGRVVNLQVTDMSEQTIQLRALLSAADAEKAWDLRCHVREQLITWIRETYPHALPRARMEATLNLPRDRRAA